MQVLVQINIIQLLHINIVHCEVIVRLCSTNGMQEQEKNWLETLKQSDSLDVLK
jgi:hypothetical protein